MRLGTVVLVHRGSTGRPEGQLGCDRWVRAKYVWPVEGEARIRLLEDDPLATVEPRRSGEYGVYPLSCLQVEK